MSEYNEQKKLYRRAAYKKHPPTVNNQGKNRKLNKLKEEKSQLNP